MHVPHNKNNIFELYYDNIYHAFKKNFSNLKYHKDKK